jgi:hypothetical protein
MSITQYIVPSGCEMIIFKYVFSLCFIVLVSSINNYLCIGRLQYDHQKPFSIFSKLKLYLHHSHKVFGSMESRYGVAVRGTLLARDFYT